MSAIGVVFALELKRSAVTEKIARRGFQLYPIVGMISLTMLLAGRLRDCSGKSDAKRRGG